VKSLSLFGLLLMTLGAVGLVFTGHLFARVPWAIAVQVVAAALMLWARVTFGARSFHASANPTEGGLVTSGPYRYIRHPIYTAICLFTLAAALASPSWTMFACWVLVAIGSWIRMRTEETLLVGMYPDYRAYAERTQRMIPYIF